MNVEEHADEVTMLSNWVRGECFGTGLGTACFCIGLGTVIGYIKPR